ncbi:corrinoid adenosyltransferase MMAB-like isoform X1 [Montipora foliosa]|uniref:corrinoid adenosyltransferase MMAB-like isoform X1 n=1 Tax=Montipora foliosa TaxID=591990 RepID=UPI0035F1D2E5
MAAEATYYCRIIFHQFASSTLIRLKFPIEVKSKLIRRMCSRTFIHFYSTSLGPKIYTRTGDKGYTSTYGGERLPKTDSIFEALGATDELSSVIGVACEFCDEAGHGDIVPKLEEIQCILQDVGSNIATPRKSSPQRNIEKTKFNVDTTKVLEEWIDAYHNQLPPLRNFILPSGGKSAVLLHVARSVCRRAERRVVPLVQSGSVEQEVGTFLNRLSDFLFTAARFVSRKEGKKEKIYRRIQR